MAIGETVKNLCAFAALSSSDHGVRQPAALQAVERASPISRSPAMAATALPP